mmetsp:Transcript_7307/g.22784  ORF Transcript_7307/g.22784 Transcript_7307/m.22784 type:complete len:425 (+) Transcript_7307:2867-4141(+)
MDNFFVKSFRSMQESVKTLPVSSPKYASLPDVLKQISFNPASGSPCTRTLSGGCEEFTSANITLRCFVVISAKFVLTGCIFTLLGFSDICTTASRVPERKYFVALFVFPELLSLSLYMRISLPFAEHASKAEPSNDQSKSETASVNTSSSSNTCETPCALYSSIFSSSSSSERMISVVGGGGVDAPSRPSSCFCSFSMLATLSATDPPFLCCFFSFPSSSSSFCCWLISFVAARFSLVASFASLFFSFFLFFALLSIPFLLPNTITRIVPSSLPTAKHLGNITLHFITVTFANVAWSPSAYPRNRKSSSTSKNISALLFVSVVLARIPRSTRFFAFASSSFSFSSAFFLVTLNSFIFCTLSFIFTNDLLDTSCNKVPALNVVSFAFFAKISLFSFEKSFFIRSFIVAFMGVKLFFFVVAFSSSA